MKRSIVDAQKFNSCLPIEFRKKSAEELSLYSRNKFTRTPKSYLKINPSDDIDSLRILEDLFQPNIYFIDFVLSLPNKKDVVVLDWGCGMGMNINYLNYCGINTYGYDAFSMAHLSKRDCIKFLNKVSDYHKIKVNLSSKLVEYDDISSISPDIISVMGVQHPTHFFVPPSVDYMIVDSITSLSQDTIKEFNIKEYWKDDKSNAFSRLLQLQRGRDKIKVCPKEFTLFKAYNGVAIFKRQIKA